MLKIWGVINLTPDSFYTGSRVALIDDFLKKARQMLQEGADILDIGAVSSRPNADLVSAEQEWLRLGEPLRQLKLEIGEDFFQQKVSVDSCNLSTIQNSLNLGIRIINDISGGSEPEILKAVSHAGAKVVLMHMQGNPQNMQVDPVYQNVTQEVYDFLLQRKQQAMEFGISPENCIMDVGIGFGKSLEHNLLLCQNAALFQSLGEMLWGVSRKSMIGQILNISQPENRLTGTVILQTYLALQGVKQLRVHDIVEAAAVRTLLGALGK